MLQKILCKPYVYWTSNESICRAQLIERKVATFLVSSIVLFLYASISRMDVMSFMCHNTTFRARVDRQEDALFREWPPVPLHLEFSFFHRIERNLIQQFHCWGRKKNKFHHLFLFVENIKNCFSGDRMTLTEVIKRLISTETLKETHSNLLDKW